MAVKKKSGCSALLVCSDSSCLGHSLCLQLLAFAKMFAAIRMWCQGAMIAAASCATCENVIMQLLPVFVFVFPDSCRYVG